MNKLFLLFIIFSFTGWFMEVAFKLIQYKKFVNRGFLIGPLCPIYGFCGLLFYLIFNNLSYSPITIFLISFVLCAFIEYLTSYILELLFHARWWDYSHKRFNLNGRICLRNLLFFGIMGLFCAYFYLSFVMNIINEIPDNILNFTTIFIFILLLLDIFVSVKLVNNLESFIVTLKQDATEEISKKIKKILIDKSSYFKRVIFAYPNFMVSKEYINNLKKKFSFSALNKRKNRN